MKENNIIMIYGANGFSAQLIVEELLSRNIKPVLAGRNKNSIKKTADKFSCSYRVFDLNNAATVCGNLKDVHTIINCAGPFRFTAKELIEACIITKTNYLDITGEIPAFYIAFSFRKKAADAGIVILPGVGFDVIPTDCLAKRLSEKMPGAVNLKLGFLNKGGSASRGTLITSLEFIGRKGLIRKNSKIIESEIGSLNFSFSKNDFSFTGISIPWGDVYTSFISTGIPNIEVYFGLPVILFKSRKVLLAGLKILKNNFIRKNVVKFVSKNFTGPSKSKRDSTETYVWGRVENSNGGFLEEVYRFMEGYNLTAKGAAEAALKVLNDEVLPGVYTPSLAFGSKFMDLFVIKRIF